MKPFQNESETLSTDGLTIENHLDRVALIGDLDLTFDKAGLRKAVALLSVVSLAHAALQAAASAGTLPDQLALIAPTPAGNLFGMPDPSDNKKA